MDYNNRILETQIAIFNGKEVRKVVHNNEWFFVIQDIVALLTDSRDPKQYIQRMKQRDTELKKGWVHFVHTLLIDTKGGNQKMLCANTEGIFRIIQSIPSPKAEPFKRWLAKVGYERIQEIEDPELATKRTKALYKAKGYPDAWIEKRMRGIAVRDELTDEWDKRGIKKQQEYAILTSEIHEAAFGIKPGDHKQLKKLKRENLRDHMTDLELIFSMLGEASTTDIAKIRDSQGFDENYQAAKEGGYVAKTARVEHEKRTRKQIATEKNYLHLAETTSKKQLELDSNKKRF